MYALTLALAMSNKFNVFTFNVLHPRDVFYLDAENPMSRFEERKVQIMRAYKGDFKSITRLQVYSGIDDPGQCEEGKLNLFSAYWQNQLLEDLTEGSVLVVDNLLTLAEEASNHQNKFKELIDFCRKLGEKKISTILIHHLGKSGQAIGTKAVEAICQNVIEIKDCSEPQKKPGANMIVTFSKCKTYPALKGQPFKAHLPYDKDNPLYGRPWEYDPAEAKSQAEVEVKTTHRIPELSDLENQIIEILIKSPKPIKRAAIAKTIGCKNDKLKSPLKKLVESEHIKMHGFRQSAKYSAQDSFNCHFE